MILLVVFVIAALIVRYALRGPTIAADSYLVLEIGGSYAEAPPQDIFGRLLRRETRTVLDLLNLIRTARADNRIKGMIAKISSLEIGWAKTQDLRDALLDFKQSGKTLVALLQPESGSNQEYYLATASDRIYLSPDVTTPLTGLSAQFVFLGGLWGKLDIEMDVEKIGQYKTAGDTLAAREMTPAHREMADSLLDSVDGQFISGLATARRLEAASLRNLIDQAPVSPANFESAHLSDGTKHLQDIHDELGGEQTPLVPMEDYAHVDPKSLGLDTGPRIAVVFAAGLITSGESGSSFQGETVGADSLTDALKEAAEDAETRAIILRIDSPGGSALASDAVWRATQHARKSKPLIVSMSDVAGSGGYYIAAGANRIVAQPGTLTGSIGVVMARPNLRGLLGRMGINTETLRRGKFADLDSTLTPLTPAGREKLVAQIDHIYDVFVARVTSGRTMTAERVDEIGRGRVWTGAQARENGLVDQLGGFMAAVQAAKEAAGIAAAEEVELTYFPEPKTFLERISQIVDARVIDTIPVTWLQPLRLLLLPFQDGSLLALMPEVIEID